MEILSDADRKKFEVTIKYRSMSKILVWLMVIIIPIVGSTLIFPFLFIYYFGYYDLIIDEILLVNLLIISSLLITILMIWGVFIGRLWRYTGIRLTEYGFLRPLNVVNKNKKPSRSSRFINQVVYGSGEKFLKFEAPDIDISSPRSVIRTKVKIVKMFIAMFIITLNFFYHNGFAVFLVTIINNALVGPVGQITFFQHIYVPSFLRQVTTFVLSFMVSLMILALTLPLILITDDACVYQVMSDGSVIRAGSGFRDVINGTFGITAIISGFTITQQEIQFAGESNILIDLITFGFVILIVTIYAVPVLFTAIQTYYRSHPRIVNKLRYILKRVGYKIANTDIKVYEPIYQSNV